MTLLPSFGTTMIPSTPRAMKPRTCSSCLLASPSAMASSMVMSRESSSARMASMAATQNSVCRVSKATPTVPAPALGDRGGEQESAARGHRRPAGLPVALGLLMSCSSLPAASQSVDGGFRIDSSWARTLSGSKTFFQSGWNSFACASRSILRAPSE